MIALRASEFRLVETVEEVTDDAFLPQEMLVPRLVAGFLVRLAVGLRVLDIRLLLAPEEVLSKEVQNGVDALLTVFLRVACEGVSELAEEALEPPRINIALTAVPHLLE